MSFDEVGLFTEFRRVHGAHTVILYGSHVRGDATAESDIDVATFADVTLTIRDARRWNGHLLDGFVYPTAVAKTFPLDADLLKLVNGRVLFDELELAGPFLSELRELKRRGPPALTDDERQMRRVWAHKSLARAGRGDVEANYRWHWLPTSYSKITTGLRVGGFRAPKSPSPISSDATASFISSSSKLSHQALRWKRCKRSCVASRAKRLENPLCTSAVPQHHESDWPQP